MWLRKDIHSICLREFKLRHQLDLLQGNSYISFNIDQLVSLVVEHLSENSGHWQSLASHCNFSWYNIVGYLKQFPSIYKILDQKKFLTFDTVILKKENLLDILRSRIKSIKNLVEIAKTISYRAQLKEVFANSASNRELYNTFNLLCSTSDPGGDKLLALGNRIVFIKDWTTKLVLKHQHTIQNTRRYQPVPIFPELHHPEKSKYLSPGKEEKPGTLVDFHPIRVVSTTKPFVKFSTLNTRSRRLSDILENDDTSQSSSDSIWSAPFKKLKRSTK